MAEKIAILLHFQFVSFANFRWFRVWKFLIALLLLNFGWTVALCTATAGPCPHTVRVGRKVTYLCLEVFSDIIYKIRRGRTPLTRPLLDTDIEGTSPVMVGYSLLESTPKQIYYVETFFIFDVGF